MITAKPGSPTSQRRRSSRALDEIKEEQRRRRSKTENPGPRGCGWVPHATPHTKGGLNPGYRQRGEKLLAGVGTKAGWLAGDDVHGDALPDGEDAEAAGGVEGLGPSGTTERSLAVAGRRVGRYRQPPFGCACLPVTGRPGWAARTRWRTSPWTSKQRPTAGRGAKGWQAATQGDLSATGAGWRRTGPVARRAYVEDQEYCPGAPLRAHTAGAAMDRHLNVFLPYERPPHHEDQLTRAAMIVMRALPLARDTLLARIGALPSARLPEPELDMQTRLRAGIIRAQRSRRAFAAPADQCLPLTGRGA